MNTPNFDGKTYELKEITKKYRVFKKDGKIYCGCELPTSTYELANGDELCCRCDEKKLEEPQKPKSVWDLNPEDRCWVIINDNGGDVCAAIWGENYYDIGSRDLGNCFFTREEAEKELAKRKAITKIKKFIIDNGMEWEWRYGVKNWDIHYDYELEYFKRGWSDVSKFYSPIGWLCLEAHAQKIIDTFPDELKLIYDV